MIDPLHIKGFLTEEECQKIIEIGESYKLDYALTGRPASNSYYVDFSFSKRRSVFIGSENFDSEISERIIKTINALNISEKSKYSSIKYFQFNKYTEGDFLSYHKDSAEIKTGATITLVIELGQEYDGGDFYYKIKDDEFNFEKGRGSLYIFDSNTEHKVGVVTNGIRYSINVWPSLDIKNSRSLL